MSTSNALIKALLVVFALALGVGFLWVGAMLLMHTMMMGAPNAMGAMMGISLMVLVFLGVLVFVLWRRLVGNKQKR